jgi:hypothetical protein
VSRLAGSPKWIDIVLAGPGLALGFGGGVVGVTTPLGMALVGAGIVYLAVELAFIAPRVLAARASGDRRERAAQEFLERTEALSHVSEVAEELARAVAAGLGPARSFLLAPSPEGEVRCFGPAGSDPPELSPDSTRAFVWLGERDGPVSYLDVPADGDGAKQVRELLDRTRCEIALPLRYRGLLLGVGLIGGVEAGADASTFYRALRSYATVAMANTFLGASTAGGAALASRIDLAHAAQTALMPDERLVSGKGYALKGVYRPVAECGGDLWAWRELDDGRLLVVIGDATGHGAAPALLAAAARGAIDGVWQTRGERLEPAELLRALNRAAYRTGRRRYLMTAFALVLDPSTGEMTYANAGQNFPYVVSGESIEALVARGNPLGSAPEAEFSTHTRTLEPGQRVLLFTDGIVEAENARGEPLGERRFRAAVSRLAGERLIRVPEALLAVSEAHVGDRAIEDDLTLVIVERAAADGDGDEQEDA